VLRHEYHGLYTSVNQNKNDFSICLKVPNVTAGSGSTAGRAFQDAGPEVLKAHGRAPVSSAMRNSLHWLNFPQRVTYKLCLLMYKCLHGLAPDYLTRLCVRVATVHGRPRLRSSNDHQLLIPWTRTVNVYFVGGIV